MKILQPEVYSTKCIGACKTEQFLIKNLLPTDEEFKICCGASDTVECLATARVEELIVLCTENGNNF